MSNSRDNTSFEECNAIRETDKSLLIEFPEYGDPVWIPKNQIDDDSEVYSYTRKAGRFGTFVIAEWIAIERELV